MLLSIGALLSVVWVLAAPVDAELGGGGEGLAALLAGGNSLLLVDLGPVVVEGPGGGEGLDAARGAGEGRSRRRGGRRDGGRGRGRGGRGTPHLLEGPRLRLIPPVPKKVRYSPIGRRKRGRTGWREAEEAAAGAGGPWRRRGVEWAAAGDPRSGR